MILCAVLYGVGLVAFGFLHLVAVSMGMPMWQAVLGTLFWPATVPAYIAWDYFVESRR